MSKNTNMNKRKTFAMVMKQDSTNTTRLTTSDQHAAESAAQHTTPATTVKVVVEQKAPILTVQILCPKLQCNERHQHGYAMETPQHKYMLARHVHNMSR